MYMPMFTTVLFRKAKIQKQSKCPSADELKALCPNNGILFHYKMEWSSDRRYGRDEPWKHAKWKQQTQKSRYCMIVFIYEISVIGKFTEGKHIKITRDWGESGMGEKKTK